jgi:hypothetical protein
VCALPTEEDVFFGTDFLSANGAFLDLSNQTLELRRFSPTNRNSKIEGKVSLTLFIASNGHAGRGRKPLAGEAGILTASKERRHIPGTNRPNAKNS